MRIRGGFDAGLLNLGALSLISYIQLEEAIFKEENDEFICKAAKTVDEAKALIEEGFEYLCKFEDVKLFRKRK